MRAGIKPSEFWELTPAEYNLIIDSYSEAKEESMYRDLRNAYYTGCFAQVEKPSEFYKKIVDDIALKPQTQEEMFDFLRSVAQREHRGSIIDFKFDIPLKLTPEFDVGLFNYICYMEGDTLDLRLPDVALSLDGVVLTPVKDVYTLHPGIVRIKYSEQVYTIVMIGGETFGRNSQ